MRQMLKLQHQMDALMQNLPALARLSSDAELRRGREAFEQRRKEAIAAKVGQI